MLQNEEVLYQVLYEVEDNRQDKVVLVILICLSIGAIALFILSYTF
jgi:hypothetical protein